MYYQKNFFIQKHISRQKWQNKNMKTKFMCLTTFILLVPLFSMLMPYPIFSASTNLTENSISKINDYVEIESSNHDTNTISILKIKWKNGTNNIFEKESEYEIFDLTTAQSFNIKRVGGKNHADIVPATDTDYEIMKEIYSPWNFSRKPMLLRINSHTFIPASLCTYPHGYTTDETSVLGHFCLYFYGSTTDKTNSHDSKHDKTVKIAYQKSKKFISSNWQ